MENTDINKDQEEEDNDLFFRQLKQQQQQNHYSLTFHRDRRQTRQVPSAEI